MPATLYFAIVAKNRYDRLGALNPGQIDAIAALVARIRAATTPRAALRRRGPVLVVTYKVASDEGAALKTRVRGLVAAAVPSLQKRGLQLAFGFRAKRPA